MEAKTAIEALAALAQETRLAVFRLLVREGPDGLPAGAIAEQHQIPAPTLSFHLSQLNAAGLVISRRDGRSIVYAVNFAGMRDLLAFLVEDCCAGRPELCAPALGQGDAEPSVCRPSRRQSTTKAC